eukprot:3824193-Prymnesium_polylepis.2
MRSTRQFLGCLKRPTCIESGEGTWPAADAAALGERSSVDELEAAAWREPPPSASSMSITHQGGQREALLTGRSHEVLEDRRHVAWPARGSIGELRRINVCKVLIEGLRCLEDDGQEEHRQRVVCGRTQAEAQGDRGGGLTSSHLLMMLRGERPVSATSIVMPSAQPSVAAQYSPPSMTLGSR